MTSLPEESLAEEMTAPGRARLDADLANKLTFHRLSFNRFDLTIDHERRVVRIEDVTDASLEGTESLTLSDFVSSLARHSCCLASVRG